MKKLKHTRRNTLAELMLKGKPTDIPQSKEREVMGRGITAKDMESWGRRPDDKDKKKKRQQYDDTGDVNWENILPKDEGDNDSENDKR